jgi:hypothetical protein
MGIEYSPAIADEICARLLGDEKSGPRSLTSICKDEDMPSRRSVMYWLNQHAEFREKYDKARADQMDFYADEIIEISDDGSRDYKEVEGKGGAVTVVDHDHVTRSRLRVDSRKWLCGKMHPRRFGDRVEHTGEGGGPIATRDVGVVELADRLLTLALTARAEGPDGQ